MERQKFCVYNQTSECFLSLDIILAEGAWAHLRETLRKRPQVFDGGQWVMRPKRMHTLGLFAPRDLVYLDAHHRVIDVVESLPSLRLARLKTEAASLLALPVHTIYSSQTQPGNQLLICVAEEMEFRLRSMPKPAPDELTEFANGNSSAWNQRIPSDISRHRTKLRQWPKLVAYDSKGAALRIQGIKDISATGLYLMTEERWPLGTRVAMTLQKTDGTEDGSQPAVTVQLKVTRWGDDGIGLAFIQAEAERCNGRLDRPMTERQEMKYEAAMVRGKNG